jgi:hypothetical protein
MSFHADLEVWENKSQQLRSGKFLRSPFGWKSNKTEIDSLLCLVSEVEELAVSMTRALKARLFRAFHEFSRRKPENLDCPFNFHGSFISKNIFQL